MSLKRLRFDPLEKVRSIANYQFGKGIGRKLFPNGCEVQVSKRTGKVRYVYFNGKLLATIRAKDSLIALTIDGAKRLLACVKGKRFQVVVSDDVKDVIARGYDVFARHIMDADVEIRPQEEVIVIDCKGNILAVGRALLTGDEMLQFRRGKAVRVRRGIEK
jgi:uncharacterized protein with predicted RNA binding PUA domain